MSVKVGDKAPSAKLKQMTAEGPKDVSTEELFRGRTVAVFAVPGAFTPTCSARHLPGYVDQIEALKAKGVDAVACVAVNDAFVMDAWGKAHHADDKIMMLADGNAEFAKALGVAEDFSKYGMGTRSNRLSMVVKDGVITQFNLEAPGAFEVSSADYMLSHL